MPDFHAPDGTRLHYTDDGAGPPILCLAGLTRNGSDFDYVAPHLAGHRLIRLDYRGRGQSEWADPASYTIQTEAQDALVLLDHLGIARAAILGTSRGGLIGMLIAAIARDRLAGLCLNDIGPDISTDGLDAIKTYVGKNPAAKTFGEATKMRAELMAGFEDVPEARWTEEVRKHYIETDDGLRINYDPDLAKVFTGDDANAAPPDLWPLFDALKGLPAAVIRGAKSNLLRIETVERMQSRRPDLIVAEVPKRGHVPFLDEPEALAAIRIWLGHIA